VTTPCKHPIVKIVAREEDAEFVECQGCGEIFDSIEYEDMAREAEGAIPADADADSEADPKTGPEANRKTDPKTGPKPAPHPAKHARPV